MILYKQITIDCAHKLDLSYESKCNDLHGHRYKIEIWINGKPNSEGMIIDYHTIKSVVDKIDHKYLNDFIPQPTIENMLTYLTKLISEDCNIHSDDIKIRIWENETSYIES